LSFKSFLFFRNIIRGIKEERQQARKDICDQRFYIVKKRLKPIVSNNYDITLNSFDYNNNETIMEQKFYESLFGIYGLILR
jgi:hypothetical protein